jgi:hypothetical protein
LMLRGGVKQALVGGMRRVRERGNA